MKRIIFSMMLCMLTAMAFAQTDTSYFDKKWQPSIKDSASYYRLVEPDGKSYIVKDFYMNHQVQMLGEFRSLVPLIHDGYCIFYDSMGYKTYEGQYYSNKRTGIWIIWDPEERDSSLIDYTEEGIAVYRHLSKQKMVQHQDSVFQFAEVMPQFPGGDKALWWFLVKEFKIPKEDKINGTHGKFYILVVIDEAGHVTRPEIIKSLSPTCDQAAIEMIQKMPVWFPGRIGGHPVKVKFVLPVQIY